MRKLILALLILMYCFKSEAQYRDNSFLFKRASDRVAKRWTLQEWLDTRDRNRMMDLWLAMNSSVSPYEAMIGAAYKSTTVDSGGVPTEHTSSDGYFTAHASIIGLTFEHENNTQEQLRDINGMLNLRIFGNSIQSTYLALHYGQRTRTMTGFAPEDAYKNQFAQISMQLYFTKYFGMDGYYRSYSPARGGVANQEMAGDLSEAGLFIDFKALRIFGSWYNDNQALAGTTTTRVGTKAGLKLYF